MTPGTRSAEDGRRMETSESKELENRVEEKRRRLEADLEALKADARESTREQREQLEAKLQELQGHIRDGWDKVSNDVAAKLNDWLKRS